MVTVLSIFRLLHKQAIQVSTIAPEVPVLVFVPLVKFLSEALLCVILQ